MVLKLFLLVYPFEDMFSAEYPLNWHTNLLGEKKKFNSMVGIFYFVKFFEYPWQDSKETLVVRIPPFENL